MSENKLTPEQLQALLEFAGKKLGMTPEQLVGTVNNNGVDALASKMSSTDATKFQAMASDKTKMEQLLNSPQAQQLIQQLLNKK